MNHDADYTPQPPVSHTLHEDVAVNDRPREKAKRHGFNTLSEAELIAVLIGTGSRGEHVMDLCKRILQDHDQLLNKLSRRTWVDLMQKYRGIGEVKALQIQAALELARRYELEKFDNQFEVRSSADAYHYLRSRFGHAAHEELWVLLLDRAKHIISAERISSGSTSRTVADIKMIVKPAITHLADAIILAHNHPSDSPQPSAQDNELTHRIQDACRTLDIKLMDHIIVCRGGKYYSYLDNGEL